MTDRDHTMTLRQPAAVWQDALPSGNGTVGALVYGNIRHEIVLLNHEALWLRKPKPTLPVVADSLPELRAMLAAGRWREAEGFLHQRLQETHYAFTRVDAYHPAFDLGIEMETRAAFSGYRRAVNFETGEVTVTWKEAAAAYARRLFVSRADDAVVMAVLGDGASKVTCRISLLPHAQFDPCKYATLQDVPITFERSADEGWLSLRGRYTRGDRDSSPAARNDSLPAARNDNPADEFGGLARVVAKGGELRTSADAVQAIGADEVVILIKLFANEAGDPALERLRGEIESLGADYTTLLNRHAPLHRELFSRLRLDLNAGEERRLSNEELLLAAYEGNVPTALVERMADYGRYLLISSSRPGGLPANLQGVWNGAYDPPWESDYHNDENIQMNYWQALPGNLPEVTLPYFDYYASWLADYRENARAVYGCRGILAPIAQSTHGMIHTGPWLNWTAGAGWLAQLFHDYWLFTGDCDFLEQRAVPFLREVALFYEDFLFEDERGRLIFSPSLSPENVPATEGASLATINATMDVAIAKEVLTNLCAACEALGIEEAGVARWHAMLDKLPAYEINSDGAIKEWIHPALPDNYHHRHQSHLYPLFPGLEVTAESAPALFEACRVAVEKRLVIGLTSQTGWSLAHMANIYARLGEGDRALECLELLSRSCLGPNFFTYHNDWRSQGITLFSGYGRRPPFQIDANFGATATVLEMLVFSQPAMVKLLPALPAKWRKGRAEGILCRGGIQVSLEWDAEERHLKARLLSRSQQEVTVKFPGALKSLEVDASVRASESGPAYRLLTLPQGRTTAIAARW